MINYFNFKKFDDNVNLITNDFGSSLFVDDKTLSDLAEDRVDKSNKYYSALVEKGFVFDSHPEIYTEAFKNRIRYSKSFLFKPTTLFIFVVTNICNTSCVYCQAKSHNSLNHGKMTPDIAKKAVDIVMQCPTDKVDIEFQGGEPLINFEVIKYIVQYARETALKKNKYVSFSLVSNLTLINDEIIDFLKENNISISTSLDGDEQLHNSNRPMRDGSDSFSRVIEKYKYVCSKGLKPGAIETTTKSSLSRYSQMIDTYVDLGLNSIFIRPLTPLGIAGENWNKIGYTPEEFIEFYRKSIDYLIEINLQGKRISEGHARIFLKKILQGNGQNYMELRSPCGASVGQMAFYFDGRIFTCDEGRMVAEMGDDAFMLGDVESTYDKLIDNSVCKSACAASVLESIPCCCECVYSPYCGTCPVVNYALDGDIFPRNPNNYRCKLYKGMLDVLFNIIRKSSDETMAVLYDWIGESNNKECEVE